jgi:predicted DNA-binding transcriptional regulator AlpA
VPIVAVMAPSRRMPRLVGAHEIRELLGVSRQRVHQLTRRSQFPAPVADLAQGKVWLRDDIDAWIAQRGRRNTRA